MPTEDSDQTVQCADEFDLLWVQSPKVFSDVADHVKNSQVEADLLM